MASPGRREAIKITILLIVLCGAPVAAYLLWDLLNVGHFAFKRPWALLLLLAVPLCLFVELLRGRRSAVLGYSSTGLMSRLRQGVMGKLLPLPGVLRLLAVALFALALARPQTRDRGSHVEVQGIDIVLVMDLSNSMEASDLVPNRLEASKRVVDSFIARRRSDQIGLVVFGRDAYTYCPLTADYSLLRTMLSDIRLGIVDGTATAIGNALGVGLVRLRNSDAKSRVIILITDGDSNAGKVTPQQMARYAQAMGVKVFTVLMGPREDEVDGGRDAFGRPIQLRRQYPINPKLLQEIADATGGRAYRATDRQGLEQNFQSILNELEKSTRRDVASVFQDAYRPFVGLGLLLVLLEALLRLTRMRTFP
jgi:Ca-activated chloride channel homolog